MIHMENCSILDCPVYTSTGEFIAALSFMDIRSGISKATVIIPENS
jgi:hypothetical protein